MQGNPSRSYELIHMGYHSGWNQHSVSRGGEKRSGSWYFTKTEPTRLPDKLDMTYERREESRGPPKVWA